MSVHSEIPGEVTVGLFSLAPGLVEAESLAAALLERVVAVEPELVGFAVLSVGAAPVPGPWWGFE
ncbi:hypothetical protein ACFY00_34615 [Kitasatospora sp. NPDC001540]|uniref:hypothetical protein n=1 Tax=Kitasatospora sp. NPDC001540 TaxID=3364014 RepID=UPI0036948124